MRVRRGKLSLSRRGASHIVLLFLGVQPSAMIPRPAEDNLILQKGLGSVKRKVVNAFTTPYSRHSQGAPRRSPWLGVTG